LQEKQKVKIYHIKKEIEVLKLEAERASELEIKSKAEIQYGKNQGKRRRFAKIRTRNAKQSE
jgi:hypothetical protein